jgi:hypothetical protein
MNQDDKLLNLKLKKMNKIYITLLLSLLVSGIWAQSIDQNKMDKDLEVAKNVLSTIMEQHTGNRFFFRGDDNITASYVSDYGVVFTVKDRFGVIFSGEGNLARTYTIARGSRVGTATAPVVIQGQASQDEEVESDENVFPQEKQKEAFKSFLKDYSNLIRQLKSSDKIMIKTSSGRNQWPLYTVAGRGKMKNNNTVTVEVKKSDLIEYETGKLTDKQIEARMVIREVETDISSEPEIEVFASVLNRLYQVDMSDTYYMQGNPWHERTKDFGLAYYLKFYSSMEDNGVFFLPTVQKEKLDKKERDNIVDDLYPEFLEGLKENILEYGHLLKNLEDGEMLMINVDLTECDDCDMPKEIELSIKKSVLDQYRAGSKSLSQAKGEIAVKKIR